MRRQKEEELRKNDLYWSQRLKAQEESLKQTQFLLETEYQKTVSLNLKYFIWVWIISLFVLFFHLYFRLRKYASVSNTPTQATCKCPLARTSNLSWSNAIRQIQNKYWTVRVWSLNSRIVCNNSAAKFYVRKIKQPRPSIKRRVDVLKNQQHHWSHLQPPWQPIKLHQ